MNQAACWHNPRFRKELLLAIIILLGALVFHYRDVILGGHTFAVGSGEPGMTPDGAYQFPGPRVANFVVDSGAIAWHHQPLSYWANGVFHAGHFPLWNPNQGLGIPAHASILPTLLDPLMGLVHLLPISLWTYTIDLQLLLRYFLAGVFTYLFMRKLGVRHIGASAAGLFYMLAPTIIPYGNIVYARLELLLPLLLFSFQRLAHNPGWGSRLWVIGSIWWMVASGFPEALPIYIGFGVIWYLVEARSQPLIFRMGQVALVGVLSGLLSAVILLPFLEYFSLAAVREAASIDTATFAEAIRHLVMFFVPSDSPYPYKMRYLYITAWLMAFCGLFVATHRRYAVVFMSAVGVLIAIVVRLPGFNLFNNISILTGAIIRFAPPLIAFLVACVAGIGIESWVMGKLRVRVMAGVGGGMIGALLFARQVAFQGDHDVYLIPFAYGIVIGIILFFILLTFRIFPRRFRAPVIIISLMLLSIWWTLYYPARPLRYDPFTKPPYVQFLEQQEMPFRVMALDSFLHPNTATSVNVQDIGYVDALLPARLANFAQDMLFNPQEASRFVGKEDVIYFDRGLNMANVRYIVADRERDSLARYRGLTLNIPAVQQEIGGEIRSLAAESAGSFTAQGIVPVVSPMLQIGFGVEPSVWACECDLEGGVTFRVEIHALHLSVDQEIFHIPPNRYNADLDAEAPVTIFEQFVDPIENVGDRHWFSHQIDLTDWQGQRVELTLTTTAPSDVSDVIGWEVPQLSAYDYSSGLALSPSHHEPIEVQLPTTDSTLHFEIGLRSESLVAEDADDAVFRIDVLADDETQTIFESILTATALADEQYASAVDLTRWGGQAIELQFTMRDGAGAPVDWAYWSQADIRWGTLQLPQVADFPLVFQDELTNVYVNPYAFPRAYIVHTVENVQGIAEARDRLIAPDFNPLTTAILEGELSVDLPAGVDQNQIETARLLDQTPNSSRYAVNPKSSGFLVVSEQYFPGWQATVDGVSTPIYVANVAMRAVYVDAGEHIVEFVYRPVTFYGGLTLSVLTLLGIIIAVWGSRVVLKKRAIRRPTQVGVQ